MERDIKEYYGVMHGYNKVEKQDIDSPMSDIAEFATNGLANFKEKKNMDMSKERSKYREQAKEAFESKQYRQATSFFDKLLEISDEDYEAKFYKEICDVLNYGPTTERVKMVAEAYKLAINNMPIEEDWSELELEYAKQLVNLVIAWYKKIKEKYDKNLADWYSYNIKEFYEYADNCKLAIEYLDYAMPVILRSDIDDYSKAWNYAWWYCRICEGHCTETLYYKVNDRDLAITSNRYCGSLGYPVKVKAPIIEKYDKMCFEIRKIYKNFEVCGALDEDGWEINEYGFDRLEPPTNYDDQQVKNRLRRIAQIEKDKEIAEKLAKWKSSGGREKEEREKKFVRYLSSHVEERTEYQMLKKEVLTAQIDVNAVKEKIDSLKTLIKKEQDIISEKQQAIEEGNLRITKLQKKIFGKAKAREEIKSIEEKNAILSSDINISSGAIGDFEAQLKKENDAYAEKQQEVEARRKKMEMFISNCLI